MSGLIQIVDENDQPVGSATKQEAWDKGLIHRIVRIMLVNDKGEFLLQRRHPKKDIYPNCWDSSVAGHVDAGEDYDTAAKRELEEELGVTNVELATLGTYFGDGVEAKSWTRGTGESNFSDCNNTTGFQHFPSRRAAGAFDVRRNRPAGSQL